MKEMKNRKWDGGYRFNEFDIKTTSKEFNYCRRQALSAGEKLVPSNISASWIADPTSRSGKLETVIGGVLQGRKQFDVRGASRVCKRRMWKLAIEIAGLAAVPSVERSLKMTMYGDVKNSSCLTQRIKVKDDARNGALKGWTRNAGGEEFGVDGVEV
jgi:tRNA-specific adenosine deaminase 1